MQKEILPQQGGLCIEYNKTWNQLGTSLELIIFSGRSCGILLEKKETKEKNETENYHRNPHVDRAGA